MNRLVSNHSQSLSLLIVAAVGLYSSIALAEDAGDQPEQAAESKKAESTGDAGIADQPKSDRAAGAKESSETESDGNGSDRILVDYTGRLQDQSGSPISGVFHFEFNLYSDSKSAEPLWTETRYVAVVDGSYTIPLGQNVKLQREHIAGPRWIGVELVGEGEILRDKLSIKETSPDDEADGEGAVSDKTKRWLDRAANNSDMTFAEVAKRAVFADRADRAESAQKVGSLTADEIERLSNLSMERLGEHIADPEAHGATGRTLGDETRVLDQVGGSGGASYRTECPPGFVVTGIKGGAGDMLDSIALICRRLQ